MRQITKKEAILIAENKLYEHWNDNEKVKFQFFQKRLAMPFSIFHRAVEKELKRPVYTHEFANIESLKKEFLGETQSPTLEEIINLIPKSKRLLI